MRIFGRTPARPKEPQINLELADRVLSGAVELRSAIREGVVDRGQTVLAPDTEGGFIMTGRSYSHFNLRSLLPSELGSDGFEFAYFRTESGNIYRLSGDMNPLSMRIGRGGRGGRLLIKQDAEPQLSLGDTIYLLLPNGQWQVSTPITEIVAVTYRGYTGIAADRLRRDRNAPPTTEILNEFNQAFRGSIRT